MAKVQNDGRESFKDFVHDTFTDTSRLNVDIPSKTTAGIRRTLQHLLKVTDANNMEANTAAASDEDVTRLSMMSPEEVEKWTDVVLGKLPGMISDAERVRDLIIPAILNTDRTDEKALIDQLVQLNYLVEITPIVDVFMHSDGVNVLRSLFESRFADVREQVWLCLTSCVQNNLKFQRHLLRLQLSKTFLYLLEKENEGKVQYKLLSVIGGYLRGYEPACRDLLKLGAIDRLLRFSCSADILPKVFLRAQRVIVDLFTSSEYRRLPTLLTCTTLTNIRKFLIAYSGSLQFEVEILIDFLNSYAEKGPQYRRLLVNSHIMRFLDEYGSELKESIKSQDLFL